VSIVQMFLKDPRVDITHRENKGCTPLWQASRNGHDKVVEWLIASGRDLGDINAMTEKDWSDRREHTALEIARD